MSFRAMRTFSESVLPKSFMMMYTCLVADSIVLQAPPSAIHFTWKIKENSFSRPENIHIFERIRSTSEAKWETKHWWWQLSGIWGHLNLLTSSESSEKKRTRNVSSNQTIQLLLIIYFTFRRKFLRQKPLLVPISCLADFTSLALTSPHWYRSHKTLRAWNKSTLPRPHVSRFSAVWLHSD